MIDDSMFLNLLAAMNTKTSSNAIEFDILKSKHEQRSGRGVRDVEDEDRRVMTTKWPFPKSSGGEMSMFGSKGRESVDFTSPRTEEMGVRAMLQPPPVVMKRSRRGPRSRSSQYRGVTYYARTGRWESHIWDCGKQVYIGGFDSAYDAARAYDRAAIKFRGVDAAINFNICDYDDDIKQAKNLTKEEFLHTLRRHSAAFSRGSSKYRGVTLHKCGRWEARMGQFVGKKAYDKASIKYNGKEAVTNFEPIIYKTEMLKGGIEENICNLDLNLSISPPASHVPIQNEIMRSFHLNTATNNIICAKKEMCEKQVGNELQCELTLATKKISLVEGYISQHFPQS